MEHVSRQASSVAVVEGDFVWLEGGLERRLAFVLFILLFVFAFRRNPDYTKRGTLFCIIQGCKSFPEKEPFFRFRFFNDKGWTTR